MTEEEKKILSTTEKTYVGLYPKHSLGYSIAKFAAGRVLGVIPKFFTMKAMDGYSKSSFFSTVGAGSDINAGEIKDIYEKSIKLKELTLTNKGFLFLYEKGTFSKKLMLIGFPLDYAKTVTSHKNNLNVYCEVSEEGKTKCFDLQLSVPNAANWEKEVRGLIST